MRIVLDLQGCQSVSRLRGIGRYSLALAKAIVRNAGDHEVWIVLSDLFPDTIEDIRASFEGLLPSERIATFSLPKLTPYQGAHDWRARAAELIREYAIAELEPDLVHISSLFEGYVDTSMTSVKAFDKTTLVAVTLYDLIPFLNPAKYLPDEGRRQHYYAKIEALKRADVLLAISEYCGEEARRELGIPASRIASISSAVADSFVRLEQNDADVRKLYSRFGISRPFLMTTGIVEPRKNLDGLIVAYSKLPKELRQRYQLFIVCQPTDLDRTRLNELARKHDMSADELVLASYVSDRDLIALYSQCQLFVFPSLHEGFGLPALEAMACGAAVIGSATTSVPEVIGREDALFNPLDLDQMADMMHRALTDEAYWQSLRDTAPERVSKFSWDATGLRALEAFESAYAQRSGAELSTGSSVIARKSAESRYRSLVGALSRLGASGSDIDLIASADAIAANQRAQRVRQLLVDVSVLSAFDAKSGIQRVTRSILLSLLNSPPAGWAVRPVRLDRQEMAYRYANDYLRSVNAADAEFQDKDEWVDTQQGDIFLGLDLIADTAPAAVGWFTAQRNRGVQIYFVVYDLLPVLRPEWFHEGIALCFPSWVETIARVSDGLIGISRAVIDDVKGWLEGAAPVRLRDLKLGYFHLGADIENSQPSSGLPDNADKVLEALRSKPTFVMVGTVEPRKGHVQAFAAFELLWADNVDVNLVIVGKAGWGVEGLPERLSERAEQDDRFFWLQGISDEYLERVYGASSCLLAASLGEGFGLPLIEAAQKGLPIIARDIPVFREVAGDHAFYFEGDTPQALADAVQAWIELDRTGLAPSSVKMPWLTWKQSAEKLNEVVLEGKWYQTWGKLQGDPAKA
ncbi:glycosyltransferase involved in cell wall biosynthesis [Caballeronia udeis]|uniref:Glycosyltransferase involved in cell wall biosynthesis n=1 Tax=Caballeronia udeis TaxID=1232866 RepID=A0ABW8MPV4_9BURK